MTSSAVDPSGNFLYAYTQISDIKIYNINNSSNGTMSGNAFTDTAVIAGAIYGAIKISPNGKYFLYTSDQNSSVASCFINTSNGDRYQLSRHIVWDSAILREELHLTHTQIMHTHGSLLNDIVIVGK